MRYLLVGALILVGCSGPEEVGAVAPPRVRRAKPAAQAVDLPARAFSLDGGDRAGGGVSVTLSMPRAVASLPSDTQRVQVGLQSLRLARNLLWTLEPRDFVGGRAEISFRQIPIGPAEVTANVLVTEGWIVGWAPVTIDAGAIKPVALVLKRVAPVGGVAVTVDVEEIAPDPVVSVP